MININMQTKELKIIKHDVKDIGYSPSLLFIKDELHVIGGSDNKCHLIWNEDKKEFDKKIFTFPDLDKGIYSHGVVHAKRKGMLYLFGGYDYGSGQFCRSIWKCDINENYKWTKLEFTFNSNSPCFDGHILTPNEKYIVIFSNPLRLFDTENDSCYVIKNEIKYHLAVLSGSNMDKAVVSGYIRNAVNDLDLDTPE